MNIFAGLAISVLLIALTAFFVMAEFAIIRVRKTRIDELAELGTSGAGIVRKLLARLDVYLSGTQLGVTMASLGLGGIGEPLMRQLFQPLFHHFGLGERVETTLSYVVGLAIITFVAVVFGELLPKWSVIQHTEKAACLIAWPMNTYIKIFYPFIWVLERSAGAMGRAIGVNPSAVGAHESAHSEDEIMAIVEAAERSGTIGASEAEIVDNVFEFAHTYARSIMVPRVDITCLSTGKTVGENVDIAVNNGFTRYPLGDPDADHIIGMIHIKDLLAIAGDPKSSILEVKREIPIVPETKPIDELLRILQKSHCHQAIVMDEYGGTAGLITLEDILEELVGEIQDEHNRPNSIEQVGEGDFIVLSTVPLRDLADGIGLEITDATEYESVGGFLLYEKGLAPEVGASIEIQNFTVTVIEMESRRVRKLRFLRAHRPFATDEAVAAVDKP